MSKTQVTIDRESKRARSYRNEYNETPASMSDLNTVFGSVNVTALMQSQYDAVMDAMERVNYALDADGKRVKSGNYAHRVKVMRKGKRSFRVAYLIDTRDGRRKLVVYDVGVRYIINVTSNDIREDVRPRWHGFRPVPRDKSSEGVKA